jgi:hypothetical protein
MTGDSTIAAIYRAGSLIEHGRRLVLGLGAGRTTAPESSELTLPTLKRHPLSCSR